MGWVWQDFITPQGVHRGYHRQTGATIGWTFTFTRGQPLQTPPGHILPFDSLTYFQPHILWRWAVQHFRFDVCQSLIISNCYFVHLIRIDTIHHQTFYFDFHGFCSDSLLPLLDRIDGPSVGFMSGAQLESRLMVERTMQGGSHQWNQWRP